MLLLHVCCASCYLNFFNTCRDELGLSEKDILLYYYNPNIHPRSEWLERLRALKKVFKNKESKLIVGEYRPRDYFQIVGKLQQNKSDKKIRCPQCWALRMQELVSRAKTEDCSIVSTTLIMSQHQDRETITRMGKKLAKKADLKFFVPEKEPDCQNHCGFYKQNYCGCVYSLQERMEGKYSL